MNARMNITFLIGNGFDLNLGLKTRYIDFLEHYLQDNSDDSDEIKAFKEDIRQKEAQCSSGEERLWANAELAFGRYTDDMVKQGKTAASFSRRCIDFCTKLASYLQKQEMQISVEGREGDFAAAIQKFNAGLTEVQKVAVEKAASVFSGGYVFNFIVFNYTCVIDQFVNAIRKRNIPLGERSYRNGNSLGQVIHVHGTTTTDMVFGVNDESQIANMELFNEQSPHYLNLFIKQKTNKSNEAQIDEKTLKIIRNSSFIYIYGMSIGDTDKIWWQRIVETMKAQPNMHVFIYCFDAPKDTLIRQKRWFFDEEEKQKFLNFADGDNSVLEPRIHIIDNNIFGTLANLVKEAADGASETA